MLGGTVVPVYAWWYSGYSHGTWWYKELVYLQLYPVYLHAALNSPAIPVYCR